MERFFYPFLFSFFCLTFFGFSSISVAFAGSYQKIAPGDTVTLGEFVFEDDFSPSTTDCTITITDPSDVEVVPPTTLMTANADGWHYYNYATAGDAPLGIWRSVMSCGSAVNGDLVKADKSFIVAKDLNTAIFGSSAISTIATSFTLTTGIETNTYLDTNLRDDVKHTLDDAGDEIDVYYEFDIGIDGIPVSAAAYANLQSGNDTLNVLAWNWDTSAWDAIGILPGTGGAVLADYEWVLLQAHGGKGNDAGTVRVRFTTQAGGSNPRLDIDFLFVSYSIVQRSFQFTGTAQGGSANTITFPTSASSIDDFYKPGLIVITSGTGAGQSRRIDGYVGSTRVATVATNWETTPDSTSIFSVLPWGSVRVSDIDSGPLSDIITPINANTDLAVQTASSSLFATLPASIWSFSGRTLTSFGTLVADVATAVWTSGTRTLTSFGTLVADVWTNTVRTLTGAGLDSGSLATLSDIQTATSSLASAITAVTSALTAEIQSGYTVTLSDFEETTVNTAYKAKLQVLNHATVPTDADSLPTLVITDSLGTVQVPAGVMTKDSNGTYSYSYSIGGSAIGGVWETVVSVVINSETVRVNDYWSLSSSPADVQIIEITDKVIPTITASVRIDNKGTAASDFYYMYCIVSSADNLCGGNDDIDSASGTAYINAGGFINLSLTLDDVPTAGTYWFKVRARALAETNWAAATEQFVAVSATVTPPPPPSGGGGGGGGGGRGATAVIAIPTTTTSSFNGTDFNGDGKVNSVDFSILLFFWKTSPPFTNPRVDINKDGKVDSVDFSILLYQWKK